MTENNPVQRLEKLSRIWSEKREKEVAVKVRYDLVEEDGCKIYNLNQIEEM